MAFTLHDEGLKILSQIGEVIIKPELKGDEEWIQALRGVDALIIGPQKLSSEAIRKAERLQVIGRHGVGFDNIDLTAATEKGIVVIGHQAFLARPSQI
ncbi:MAG: hypothetical protein ACUVTL_01640 [Thermoproteota archaeon]